MHGSSKVDDDGRNQSKTGSYAVEGSDDFRFLMHNNAHGPV